MRWEREMQVLLFLISVTAVIFGADSALSLLHG
jgi:hypothetical protein